MKRQQRNKGKMTVSIYDVFKIRAEKESVIQSLKEARLHSYYGIYSGRAIVFEFDKIGNIGLSSLGIFRNNQAILNSGGIYALYAKDVLGTEILLYVGQTDNLQRRILEHYTVSTKDSAMKNKLVGFARGARDPFLGSSEEELDFWMKINVSIRCIGYKHHSLIEKYVINALNPLLNDDRGNLNLAALDIGFISNAGLSNNKEGLNPFAHSNTPLSRAGLFNSIR